MRNNTMQSSTRIVAALLGSTLIALCIGEAQAQTSGGATLKDIDGKRFHRRRGSRLLGHAVGQLVGDAGRVQALRVRGQRRDLLLQAHGLATASHDAVTIPPCTCSVSGIRERTGQSSLKFRPDRRCRTLRGGHGYVAAPTARRGRQGNMTGGLGPGTSSCRPGTRTRRPRAMPIKNDL